jgi:hypothetical protein
VGIELSADSARALAEAILQVLDSDSVRRLTA